MHPTCLQKQSWKASFFEGRIVPFAHFIEKIRRCQTLPFTKVDHQTSIQLVCKKQSWKASFCWGTYCTVCTFQWKITAVPNLVFLIKNDIYASNLFAKSNPEKLIFLRDVLYRLLILLKNYGGTKSHFWNLPPHSIPPFLLPTSTPPPLPSSLPSSSSQLSPFPAKEGHFAPKQISLVNFLGQKRVLRQKTC